MPDITQPVGDPRHDFLADYSVQTRTDNIPVKVDAQGTFFIATDSPEAYPFDMSFDGQKFFKWNVGLALPKPSGFNALWFRSRDNQPVNLEFLAGNVSVVDARLSIVRDPNHYQIFNFQVAATLDKAFATAQIAANGNVLFPGRGSVLKTDGSPDAIRSAGANYAYRKSICVTNNDPGVDLEIYTLKPTATAFTANGDGTYKVNSLTDCVRAATPFFRQAWFQETNADIVVANETGTAINCRVLELFYPAAGVAAVSP